MISIVRIIFTTSEALQWNYSRIYHYLKTLDTVYLSTSSCQSRKLAATCSASRAEAPDDCILRWCFYFLLDGKQLEIKFRYLLCSKKNNSRYQYLTVLNCFRSLDLTMSIHHPAQLDTMIEKDLYQSKCLEKNIMHVSKIK